MALVTDIGKFRLELGDTPASYGLTPAQPSEFEACALFNDDEVQYFLSKHPTNLLLSVADACDALAARFARAFDFEANGDKKFAIGQKHKAYLSMAARLRARAVTEGNSDGTGGVPTFGFPAPHDWQDDLAGVATTVDPVTDWPL